MSAEEVMGMLLMVVLIVSVVVWYLVNKKQVEYVKENSERYKALLDINKEYSGIVIDYPKDLKIGYRFETKPRFDNANNRDKVFKEYLYEKKDMFKYIYDSVEINRNAEYDYKDDFDELMLLPSVDKYTDKERKLIAKEKNAVPFNTDFKFIHENWYQSPKGRNTYTSTREVDIHDIHYILDDIKNGKKQKSEYEIFRDAERAKMTAGLRYDILARDNHRCQICGASANTHGVTLHVDHIVPVAKGGRTVEHNLQTLCRACNLGKGVK